MWGTAFLSLLDVDASDHYALCGDITRTELEDILSRTRLAGNAKLTFGQKAKIRMAFRVARAMAGIAEPADLPPSVATPVTTLVSSSSGAVVSGDPHSITLGEAILQGNDTKIKILGEEVVAEARETYFRAVGNYPTEDEDIAEEQLSALVFMVTVMR